ncbi:MAG: RNA polymerase sigma factor [Candidatus Magasanikbacteria bacterium]|nr:RNA polymerase sigma factor [Candidatus Magasanikbacteria bacterium]
MSRKKTKKEFEDFYNSHIDKVYRFVFFRVNCDKDLAQDLVSEIFIKAVEHFADYDPAISKTAWIMTITRNHLANHWRDRKPTLAIPEDETGLAEGFWLHSAIGLFKKEEAKQELNSLLEGLDKDSREIVTFHYILGYSYAEIAEMKNMTETAVKVAAHRIIKKLYANI